MKALGMIETRGLVAAIEALDAALKTADVDIVNRHIVKGGIVTVEICGDVGAIKVATEAGAAAAKRLGNFIGCHVIARPDEMVYEMIENEKIDSEVEENKEGKEEKVISSQSKIEQIETKEKIVEKTVKEEVIPEKKTEATKKEEKNKKK